MQPSSKNVFRAYDIRGLSPEELDETFAQRLGQAIVRQFAPRRVLVGRDMRLTSVRLEAALIEAFVANGVDVVAIGLCSTPLFNVTVGLSNGGVDMGVMVTASHNPGKYNGFKLVRGDASPIGQGSGMEELAETFFKEFALTEPQKRGTVVEDKEALGRYVDHILKLAALPAAMPEIKIAIDAGNGMAGVVIPELLSRLPWLQAIPLYFEPDGTFPNHEANPIKTETLDDLRARVLSEKCAFGMAFDGDADRVGFVDDSGALVAGDISTALLAQEVLKNAPGGLVLYDVRSSWTVPEAISEAGGRHKMCRVGHAFIKKQMRLEGAVFAGEISMHYYFHSLRFVESGELALLYILRHLAREGLSLRDACRPLLRYAHSGEINFEVGDKEAVLTRLRENYAPAASKIIEIDGIRLEFKNAVDPGKDWWFNVRASNTEPLLRLNVESRSEDLTRQKVAELSEIIRL